jgi:shikimate 5-dehydrogenase
MTKPRMLIGLIGANIQGSMSPALFADAFAAAKSAQFERAHGACARGCAERAA